MKSMRSLRTVKSSVFFGLLFFKIWTAQAFAYVIFSDSVTLNRQRTELSGTQTEEVYASSYGNGQLFGYIEYLPPGYAETTEKFPVVISLHDIGQLAEGDQIEFDKIRTGGQLAKRVSQGQDFPFIIITPQQPQDVKDRYKGKRNWDPYLIDEVLEKVKSMRRVDVNRIYICGESMGGGGVWKYLELFGDKIAAAVSIAGTRTTTPDVVCSTEIKNTPVWAFHCDGDALVSVQSTLDMVKAINECNPTVKAKQTIFSSRNHNAWDWVYDFSERALSPTIKSAPYGPMSRSQNILSWMLSYRLSNNDNNQTPVAKAESIQEISSSDSVICLNGGQSYDSDGTIITYFWKQINGTELGTYVGNEAMLRLKDIRPGTYEFELTVIDDKGGKATDTVMAVVKTEANDLNGFKKSIPSENLFTWIDQPDLAYIDIDNISDMTEDFVKAYPSYLESELTVEYSGSMPTNNRITLYSQNGDIYFTNTILLSPHQLLQIDLLPLHIPAGLIYLKVENRGLVKTVKLFKK